MSHNEQPDHPIAHWYEPVGDGVLSSRRHKPVCGAIPSRVVIVTPEERAKAIATGDVPEEHKCPDCVAVYEAMQIINQAKEADK